MDELGCFLNSFDYVCNVTDHYLCYSPLPYICFHLSVLGPFPLEVVKLVKGNI